ncbi:hypothetical protein NDU88_001107 [Pleurodeles waltl]|uniref:Uncharacterized protein n=1 Tax=Pleurodeles waltl TaxID=8319 RepID=A0AAV7M043_PLEWA|nr:hypothetical protein NDU88_001107 [Pleurodeles waltl]
MIPCRPQTPSGACRWYRVLTRGRAQTLSPSGEPGVRIELAECRQSNRDAGTDNSVLPVIRGMGGQCRRLLPQRHLGQLLLKRDARIGAAYRELCGLRVPEARHRHGPLRGLSQAAGLSFRPLAPGAGRPAVGGRNWLLRRRFGLLLVAANGGYLSVTSAGFPRPRAGAARHNDIRRRTRDARDCDTSCAT